LELRGEHSMRLREHLERASRRDAPARGRAGIVTLRLVRRPIKIATVHQVGRHRRVAGWLQGLP
jgi:hypothetical protein